MKKFALILLFPWVVFATPVGNTAAPEIIQEGFWCPRWSMDLRAGYEGDFVADARFGQYDQSSGRVDSYIQHTNSGVVTWNFVDRLDIYGVFGMSKTKANWRFTETSTDQNIRIQLKARENFLWGLGSRAILYEWCDIFLGMGGRYSEAHYGLKRVSTNGNSVPTAGSQIHWREWQLNLDVSCKIKIFTPYVGTKYSHSRSLLSGFSTAIAADGSGSNSFKNRSPVGFYLGCALSNGKFFALNLEGRLIDEEAVTVVADFRF